MKTKTFKSTITRIGTKTMYLNKYYNIYLHNNKIIGLTTAENEYIKRQFWTVGTISAYKNPLIDDKLFFLPYASSRYDYMDYPMKLMLINIRNIKGIPRKILDVGKDVLICYAQHNHKPIREIVEWYVNRITDVEMVIGTNLKTHKLPWLLVCNEEDEYKLREVMNLIEEDETEIYLSAENVDKIKSIANSSPYIIDKLYEYKTTLESELETYLGIDNSKSMENRMLVDQINANNEVINENAEALNENIEEWLKDINALWGFSLELEKPEVVVASNEAAEEKQDDNK